ncbi:oxygenase MpaB family protein [Amycolatopsis albispora]|uniref:ER-bound oxygenase mpaB/mpaB'/Rubber oxygenase catalytic domain-containing protein n=1 Tax=Amycolatopsis albispora TaxID=1804986 RepID=A0A344L532_9PSEU|nr:oxygenase MpaB family protein [Amycolatopsis albispora]AXB43156.1 hypothetical protein A4R43_11830 [Amycolatopsis albispora]
MPELDDAVLGAGLLAGTANVIMQLGRPGVGYGVAESKVHSGNVFHHPVKRTRTTLTYLAVATLGTDEERRAYRRAVNRQHAQVRSTESSPVRYNAFDEDLQLWVAACLYKGFEDTYTLLGGGREVTDEMYEASAAFGTTLQVRPESWPADRDAFAEYWEKSLDRVDIDDRIRAYLTDLVELRFLPRVARPFAPLHRFVTTGFLPPRFREEMRLPWSHRRQRRFDALMRAIAVVVRLSPGPLRRFPYNLCLWDLRRRLAAGRPLV